MATYEVFFLIYLEPAGRSRCCRTSRLCRSWSETMCAEEKDKESCHRGAEKEHELTCPPRAACFTLAASSHCILCGVPTASSSSTPDPPRPDSRSFRFQLLDPVLSTFPRTHPALHTNHCPKHTEPSLLISLDCLFH